MNPFELQQLERLTTGIGNRLGWGSVDRWRGSDFEKLSQLVYKKTGKRLSVTTLKRLWGRAALDSNPSPTTLDILAEFAGFESWRDFIAIQREVPQPVDKWKKWKILWLACVIPLTCVALYLVSNNDTDAAMDPPNLEGVVFDLEKVTSGYPNTVIFHYDVGDNDYDSLAIQQSWDQSRRIRLEDSSGLVTSTYYYPGYYLAKLILNDVVLAEKELYIPTSGWQGMLATGSDIHYLEPEEIVQEESVGVVDDVLSDMEDQNVDYLYLAHLTDDPVINSEKFEYEVDFRMVEALDGSICQGVQMIITGTREVLGFTFGLAGCAGEFMFFLNQDMIFGSEHDLSAFGITPDRWCNFKLRNEQQQLTVWIDDKKVFTHEMKSDIGKIGGVQWYFEGVGEIRDLSIGEHSGVVNMME